MPRRQRGQRYAAPGMPVIVLQPGPAYGDSLAVVARDELASDGLELEG